GQCGNQIGGSLWPLILQEYNVNLYSDLKKNNVCPSIKKSFSNFFNVPNQDINYGSLTDLLNNKVKARVVCIDMEDSVVARFTNGPLRGLFDKKSVVTNYPGSGNNWAEGYCGHGPVYKEKILKAIKHVAERCDNLHGFFLLFSAGGGTGSGLGTYVLKLLADYYPAVERFVACVYPTGTEDVITCPYNMGFATQELLDNATCVFPVENRALLDMISRQTKVRNMENISLNSPFDDMNSIIVNMLLHVTSGSRFPGNLNFDMNELNTNMVPFPRLNFLSTGFNPLPYNGLMNIKKPSKQLKDELFLASCNRINQLVKIDPIGPKSTLIGTTIIGRGDFTLTDMRSYVDKIQTKARFTPWSSKTVKIGLCNIPPHNSSLALFSVFNTSSMANLFDHIHNQFNMLYRKKAHVHHYTKISGFDVDFFKDCNISLVDIIESYKEIEELQPLNIPRLKPLNI
ncbi:hypothetical protein NQ317_012877, partial [Molorchus minor]